MPAVIYLIVTLLIACPFKVSGDEVEQMLTIAFQHCTNELGEFDNETLNGRMLVNQEGVGESCADFLIRISSAQESQISGTTTGGCIPLNSDWSSLDNLATSSAELNQKVGCNSGGIAKCVGGLGCDLYYSFFSLSMIDPVAMKISSDGVPPSKMLARGLADSLQLSLPGLAESGLVSSINSCSQGENRNCVSTFIQCMRKTPYFSAVM